MVGRVPFIGPDQTISIREFNELAEIVKSMQSSLTSLAGSFSYRGMMGSVGRASSKKAVVPKNRWILVKVTLDPNFNLPGDMTSPCGFRYYLWPPHLTSFTDTTLRLSSTSVLDYRGHPENGMWRAAPNGSYGFAWRTSANAYNVIVWLEHPETEGCS